MKISFLKIGLLSVSIFSVSIFSVKKFELHLHWDAPAEAKRDPPKVVVNPIPTSTSTPEPQVDPPLRINFRRGSTGETISGNIAGRRSYVLRAREGQQLSAAISSANGCMVFDGGTTTVTFRTVKGDNWLGLVNNCGAQSTFSLTVSIL